MTKPASYWRWLIAINAAIMIAGIAIKVTRALPSLTYIHLLVDYHFGFIKRGLIGELLSLVTSKVSPWMVFALGGATIVVTLLLYLKLFQKTFGFSERTLPLFVLIVGSPMFFKNFINCIGYFDIYGCALAIVLLLIPAESLAFVAFAVAGSIVLILIHHIHMLLYIPTVAAIVIVRYFLLRPVSRTQIAADLVLAALVPAAFFYMQFAATMHISREEFGAYLAGRMGGHGPETKALAFMFIWYQTLAGEIATTRLFMPRNLAVSWFYVVLLALHAPLIGYFREVIRSLASPGHRRIVLMLLGTITLGYGIIFATVYDYARWFSSWSVCMILMLHAIKQLPAAEEARPIATDDKLAFTLASILAFLPRVGITKPF